MDKITDYNILLKGTTAAQQVVSNVTTLPKMIFLKLQVLQRD